MPINTLRNNQRWQPNRPVRLNLAHDLTRGLIFSAFNSAVDAGAPPLDYVTGRAGTVTSVSRSTDPLAVASTYNGTSSCAQFAINMNAMAPRLFAVTFSLWWDSYANDNDMAIEYGNANTTNGWCILPNHNSGAGVFSYILFMIASSGNCFNPTNRSNYPAGQWNNIVVNFNRNNLTRGTNGVYSNGVLVTDSQSATFASVQDNSNTNLNIMCRNQASLFGAGRLRNLNIYNRHLTAEEAFALHSNPYQIVQPIKRIIYMLDGFGDPNSAAKRTRYYIAT